MMLRHVFALTLNNLAVSIKNKTIFLILFIPLSLMITLTLTCITIPAFAENPVNYFVIKGGLYSPSDTHDLNNFNSGNSSHLDSKTGFNGKLAIGHYFLPVFAVELGAGYFESKGSPAAEPGHLKLKVVPVVATAKLFLPLLPIEPFVEFGIGSYFTELDVEGCGKKYRPGRPWNQRSQ